MWEACRDKVDPWRIDGQEKDLYMYIVSFCFDWSRNIEKEAKRSEMKEKPIETDLAWVKLCGSPAFTKTLHKMLIDKEQKILIFRFVKKHKSAAFLQWCVRRPMDSENNKE